MSYVIFVDEFNAGGEFGVVLEFTVGGVCFTVKNVFENGIVENNWFLHDKRNGFSKIIKIDVLDVDTVKKDLTVINVVKSHEKVNEGTLSTSTFTNKGD